MVILNRINGSQSAISVAPKLDWVKGNPSDPDPIFLAAMLGRSGASATNGSGYLFTAAPCSNITKLGWLHQSATEPVGDWSSYSTLEPATDQPRPNNTTHPGATKGLACFGLPFALQRLFRGAHPIAVGCFGVQGVSLDGVFGPATSQYMGFLNWLTNMKRVADAIGKKAILPAISFSHQYGDADYAATFTSYYNQLNVDVRNILGQDHPDVMFFAEQGDVVNVSQEAHITLEKQLSRYHLVYSRHQVRDPLRNDGVHFNHHGYREHIEMDRVVAERVLAGLPYKPFMPKTATINTPRSVDVEFQGPDEWGASMVWRQADVDAPLCKGCYLYANDQLLDLSAVEITGAKTLRVTASADIPSAQLSFGIATEVLQKLDPSAPNYWKGVTASPSRGHSSLALPIGYNHLAISTEGVHYPTGGTAPNTPIELYQHSLVRKISVS